MGQTCQLHPAHPAYQRSFRTPALACHRRVCYNASDPTSLAREHEPTAPPEVDPVPRSKATVTLRALLTAALLLGLLPSPALAAAPRALDRLTAAQPSGTPGYTESYAYDANGNMLTRPGQTLAWDAENRLASVATKPGTGGNWLDSVPAKYRAPVAQTFRGGTPKVEVTAADQIVYHRWDGSAKESGSSWYSPSPYVRAGNARRFLALPSGNTAEHVSAYRIPAGTTIIRGKVASQASYAGFGGYATGGGVQIYLPDPTRASRVGP